jgi:hypothetical protein
MGKAKGGGKVPVTPRALLARLNRQLRHEDRMLKTCAPRRRWYDELGDFYLVNVNRAWIERRHVDLEAFAREHNALRPWERLADEETT